MGTLHVALYLTVLPMKLVYSRSEQAGTVAKRVKGLFDDIKFASFALNDKVFD